MDKFTQPLNAHPTPEMIANDKKIHDMLKEIVLAVISTDYDIYKEVFEEGYEDGTVEELTRIVKKHLDI